MEANRAQDTDDAVLVDRFQEILTGSWMTQALYAAAELRIADLLAAGPKTSEELAVSTGAHPPSLRRLLLALSTIDVCRQREDGSFELAPLGALLRTNHPHSLRHWAAWWAHHLWPVWGNLLHSVKTGESARKLLYGTEGFEHLNESSETAETFYHVTVELTRPVAQAVVRRYDFSDLKRIVDVGGGHGELLALVLEARPETFGVLLDRPTTMEGAKRNFEKAHPELMGRCEFLAGDFFESVPKNADAYMLKSVLHDWDDERCLRILKNCRRAMTEESRLLIIEPLLPQDRTASSLQRTFSRHDLTMLVACGAQERTEPQFQALLAMASLRVSKIVQVDSVFSVIEAFPV